MTRLSLRTHFWLVLVLLLSFLPQSLARAEGETRAGPDLLPVVFSAPRPAIIPRTTKVLSNTTLRRLTSISPNGTYTFSSATSELKALHPGDVITGEPSSAAPNGFLRKVSSISTVGKQVMVKTTQASLEDAIQQGTISFSRTLTPDGVKSTVQKQGMRLGESYSPQGRREFNLPLEAVVLYDADGNEDTQDDQIVASGSITLSPGINFSATIKNSRIQELSFSQDVRETSNLTILSEVEYPTAHEQVQLAQYYFSPIVIMVGIPIVFTPLLTVSVGLDGSVHAGISTGAAATYHLASGLKYAQGKWSPYQNLDIDFINTPPMLSAGLELKGYTDGQIALMIDGVAGPSADVQPYLKLSADPAAQPWWTLSGGLEAKAGVELKVLSRRIANYETTLVSYERILAQAAVNYPPVVDVKINDSDGPVYLTNQDAFTVSWTSTNAVACTGSNALAGKSGLSGSYTDGPMPSGSYSYTMTCSNGSLTSVDQAVLQVSNPVTAQQFPISGGVFHTCALTQAGGVRCWGYNHYGEAGDGTTRERLSPVDVTGLTSGVISISAGAQNSCALTQAGGVKCWGWNYYGELGDGSTTSRWTPVDVSGLSSGVSAISAGVYHTCALTQAGGVKCWGSNDRGQLGDGSTTERLTPVDVSGLSSGVGAISAGGEHTCALTLAGGVKCWGYDYYGELGDGTTTDHLTPVDVTGLTSGVSAISAGQYHTCALTQAGGVKCWGYNEIGALGDGTTTGRLTPVDVAGLTSGVNAIAAGYLHTCALTQAGGVKCWGWNNYGELGDGTKTDHSTPLDVTGLTEGVSAIGAGETHTCALTQAGGFKCWGWNGYGQLGDGTTTDHLTPADVIGFP